MKIKRECVNETIKHKFVEREFDVPKLYDKLLTVTYGENYMTPVQTHIHVVQGKIKF